MNRIVVFCGSSLGFNPTYKEAAVNLGEAFIKHNISLVYGGGKIGMMGAIADTMLAKKGEVIGVIPKLLEKEEVLHKGATQIIVSKNMSERKVIMSKMVDGYITLPGGFGTLDELFEALTLNQLHIEQKPVGLLNVNGYFDATLNQIEKMVNDGFLRAVNKDLLLVSDTIDDLLYQMENFVPPIKTHVINKVVR